MVFGHWSDFRSVSWLQAVRVLVAYTHNELASLFMAVNSLFYSVFLFMGDGTCLSSG